MLFSIYLGVVLQPAVTSIILEIDWLYWIFLSFCFVFPLLSQISSLTQWPQPLKSCCEHSKGWVHVAEHKGKNSSSPFRHRLKNHIFQTSDADVRH